jgi:hypothetical protein
MMLWFSLLAQAGNLVETCGPGCALERAVELHAPAQARLQLERYGEVVHAHLGPDLSWPSDGGTYVRWGPEGVTSQDSPGVWMTVEKGRVEVLDRSATLHRLEGPRWTRHSLDLPPGGYQLRAAGRRDDRWAVSATVSRGATTGPTTLVGGPGAWQEHPRSLAQVVATQGALLLVDEGTGRHASVLTASTTYVGPNAELHGAIAATAVGDDVALMGAGPSDELVVATQAGNVPIPHTAGLPSLGGCLFATHAGRGRARGAHALAAAGGALFAIWLEVEEQWSPHNVRQISYCAASGGQRDCGMVPEPVTVCDQTVHREVRLRVAKMEHDRAETCMNLPLSAESHTHKHSPAGGMDLERPSLAPSYAAAAVGESTELLVGTVEPSGVLRLMVFDVARVCT